MQKIALLLCLSCIAPTLWALDDEGLDALRTLSEVLHYVSESYVEPIDDAELMKAAAYGIMERLDPHSHYFDKKTLKRFNDSTKGRYGGVGLEVTKKRRKLTVVSALEHSPAHAAGLRPGDFITKIDRKPTKDMSLHDASGALRGRPGSTVSVTVVRPGRTVPFVKRLRREKLNAPSVRARFIEPGYAYVRVTSYKERTYAEFHQALQRLGEEHPIEGLVVDVRNNPGGVLSQGIEMVDHFLPEGVIITRQARGKEVERFEASDNGLEPSYPVVVLVNGGSASASEVFAGALQDHKRALVLGTQSFGKGSVQKLIDLSHDAALKMTISHYYTPSKRKIHGVGITPDVIVMDGSADETASRHKLAAPVKANVKGRMRLRIPEVESGNDHQRAVALAMLKNGTVARVTR